MLGNRLSRFLSILPGTAKIEPILSGVDDRANERANADGQLYKSGLKDIHVVVGRERLRYAHEEEKEDSPSEAYP